MHRVVREFLQFLVAQDRAFAEFVRLAVPHEAVAVARCLPLQLRLDLLGQGVVGGRGAGELGGAVADAILRGHLQRVQQGKVARRLQIAEIGMPVAPGVVRAERYAVLADVRDPEDFRNVAVVGLGPDVHLRRSEAPREAHKVRRRQIDLAPDHDDGALGHRVGDRAEVSVADLRREVGAVDRCADGAWGPGYVECAHRILPEGMWVRRGRWKVTGARLSRLTVPARRLPF